MPTELEVSWRHSGWAPDRQRVWDALERTAQTDARRAAFATCGSKMWVEERDDKKDHRCRCNACHDRFCRPCAAARRARLIAAVTDAIGDITVRFLTLTLRHSQTPLKAQIDRLYRCFRLLRRSSIWLGSITGGAAFFEAKVSERDELWHPHLHCLVVGTWIDQKAMSEAWHAITGDSSVVDIRRPDAAKSAVGYVTKYITKPCDDSVLHAPDRLDEFMLAIRGRRLCTTFGTWRGIQLDAQPADDHQWTSLAPLESIWRAAHNGDAGAVIILKRLHVRYPTLRLDLPPARPPPGQYDERDCPI